jgi:hypothetical protein
MNNLYFYSNPLIDIGLKKVKENIKIIASDNDFKQCVSILKWTFYNFLYLKEDENYNNDYALEIINYAKINKLRVNCLCHAIVMNELLLSYGYKSRKIFCFNDDYMPKNNHVLVEAYIDSMKKWVVFDPTANSYFTDGNKVPLSLKELSKLFSENRIPNIAYSKTLKIDNLHKILDYNEDNYIKYLNSVMYKFLSCSTQHTKYFLKEEVYYLLVSESDYICIDYIVWETGKKCKAKIIKNEELFWR